MANKNVSLSNSRRARKGKLMIIKQDCKFCNNNKMFSTMTLTKCTKCDNEAK
jgi:hypothetical protein